MYGGKVFGIAAEIQSTVLSIVSSIEDAAVVVQLVGHGGAVNFHAGGEDDEIVPLRHHIQEIIQMRPFINEEAHGMFVDDHFEDEIRRRSRFNGLSYDAVVMRMD